MGTVQPDKQGGDRRSKHIDAHAAAILALCEATPDITLADKGIQVGIARFGGSSIDTASRVKKDGARGRTGATSPDAKTRGMVDSQLDLDPRRLVFIDETSASTKMAHLYGRAPKGSGRGQPFRTVIGRLRRSPQICDWAA